MRCEVIVYGETDDFAIGWCQIPYKGLTSATKFDDTSFAFAMNSAIFVHLFVNLTGIAQNFTGKMLREFLPISSLGPRVPDGLREAVSGRPALSC